jgi:hypothetical protein
MLRWASHLAKMGKYDEQICAGKRFGKKNGMELRE